MDDKEYTKEDCLNEIEEHCEEVFLIINNICGKLLVRAIDHDNSKKQSPELEFFIKNIPILKKLTFGSKEYNDNLKELGVGLDHHYKHNRHHPEHWANGINDMNLIDIIEMFADWMAVVKKYKDGNIYNSIEINKKRFNMSDQLVNIFINTVDDIRDGE